MSENSSGRRNVELRLPANEVTLPKRFYKSAGTSAVDGGFAVVLDGRPVRSPGKKSLAVPTKAYAAALANEWEQQLDVIDPASMPLTRLANSAIDGVNGREDEVRDDLVKYAGSDLLCYRAEHPHELVQRQAYAWDPIVDWAREETGVQLSTGSGVMPIAQDEEELAKLRDVFEAEDHHQLTALHVMTTLTGSAILALAVRRGHCSADSAWQAAHVDEDWQIEQWGEDAEAAARRAHRWEEMKSAALVVELLEN